MYRWFPPSTPVSSIIKIEKILKSSIIGSSLRGFRSRDEISGRKFLNMNEE
jgi:hypothetical protein